MRRRSGAIHVALDTPQVHWSRPWTLLVADLNGWRVVGRYRSEDELYSAAKRQRIDLPERTRNIAAALFYGRCEVA